MSTRINVNIGDGGLLDRNAQQQAAARQANQQRAAADKAAAEGQRQLEAVRISQGRDPATGERLPSAGSSSRVQRIDQEPAANRRDGDEVWVMYFNKPLTFVTVVENEFGSGDPELIYSSPIKVFNSRLINRGVLVSSPSEPAVISDGGPFNAGYIESRVSRSFDQIQIAASYLTTAPSTINNIEYSPITPLTRKRFSSFSVEFDNATSGADGRCFILHNFSFTSSTTGDEYLLNIRSDFDTFSNSESLQLGFFRNIGRPDSLSYFDTTLTASYGTYSSGATFKQYCANFTPTTFQAFIDGNLVTSIPLVQPLGSLDFLSSISTRHSIRGPGVTSTTSSRIRLSAIRISTTNRYNVPYTPGPINRP